MRKIFFTLVMCAAFVSYGCKTTAEDIAIQNAISLKKQIEKEIINTISRQLKDPTSLKFAENTFLVQKVANPIDIKNNKDIAFLFEDGVDYYNVQLLEYYGKNGFGAYNGTNYATMLIKVKILNTNEKGINDYYVDAFDCCRLSNWIEISQFFLNIEYEKKSFYKNELSPKNSKYLLEMSNFIKLDDELVM